MKIKFILSSFAIHKLDKLTDHWTLYKSCQGCCCCRLRPLAHLSLVRSLSSQNCSKELTEVLRETTWQETHEMVNRPNCLGYSALQIAMASQALDCLVPLLEAGADMSQEEGLAMFNIAHLGNAPSERRSHFEM